MNRSISFAAVGAACTLLFIAVTGAAPRKPAPAQPAASVERVEYRFFVPSSTAAFTAEHEKELNALGDQGWRVVTPIYSGGMLNSYLMMRAKP